MKEEEIRPLDLLSRYMELVRADVKRFFADPAKLTAVACPGCADKQASPAFKKQGFTYSTCGRCGTLYASPRPSPEQMARFYEESESARFWSTHFFKETEAGRRIKMFRPRAELVKEVRDREGLPSDACLADVGAGYGTFLEEVRRAGGFARLVGVEPEKRLAAVCRGKGFDVLEKTAEAASDGDCSADFASAFEVLEHTFSPAEFLSGVGRLLKPRGLFLLTTLTVDGFDIQVLWDRSRNVYPPHHINILSVKGVEALAEMTGFEVLELTTPGKLDVDITANVLKESPDPPPPRFVASLLSGPEDARRDFQAFLAAHRMSSHLRTLLRKKPI